MQVFPVFIQSGFAVDQSFFQGGNVGLDDGSHQLLGGQWACFAFLDLSDGGHQRRGSECDYHQKGEGCLFFRAWIRV